MNTIYGSAARMVLATTLIFASFQRSEAIRWRLQPEKPTVLVETVNNSRQSLVWDFVLDGGESLRGVKFQRQKDVTDSPKDLAANIDQNEFTVFEPYRGDYNASLPSTLHLKNAVTNEEEFVYSIEVSYLRNNRPVPGFTDTVRVIVKVPPKITVPPQNHTTVKNGTNVTMTCNASGDPFPNITWTKVGVAAAQFNATGHKLYLVNVQKEDLGSYKCTADNGYGTPATSLALVDVKPSAPSINPTTKSTTQSSTHDPKPVTASLSTTEAPFTEQQASSATRAGVKIAVIAGGTILIAIMRIVFS